MWVQLRLLPNAWGGLPGIFAGQIFIRRKEAEAVTSSRYMTFQRFEFTRQGQRRRNPDGKGSPPFCTELNEAVQTMKGLSLNYQGTTSIQQKSQQKPC